MAPSLSALPSCSRLFRPEDQTPTVVLTLFANLDELAVSVLDQTGDVAPGTYGIGQKTGSPTSYAVVNLSTTGAECSPEIDDSATSGTVTLSQVSATRVAGSYSATFGDAGVLSGSFDVPICVFSDGHVDAGATVSSVCVQ